jgi:hypothetical protein
VASSLLGSLYGGIGSLQSTNAYIAASDLAGVGGAGGIGSSGDRNFTSLSDYAAKFSSSRLEDQYVFRAVVDIREEDPKIPLSFASVPKEKEFFKLKRNADKQINIQIQQVSNQPLEIERCFGILMCQGRNVSHKDMQLLQTISMGKPGSGATGAAGTGGAGQSDSSGKNLNGSAGNSNAASYANNGYMVRNFKL